MYFFFGWFLRVINWLGLLAGILILIASIFTTFEVFMRYFMHKPTAWTYDLSRYLLVCIIFLGASFALKENGHINVDFVIQKLNHHIRKYLKSISYIVVLIFSSVVIWKSYGFYIKAIKGGWKTVGTFLIPSSWIYLIIILGSSLLALTAIVLIVLIFKNKPNKFYITSNKE